MDSQVMIDQVYKHLTFELHLPDHIRYVPIIIKKSWRYKLWHKAEKHSLHALFSCPV